MFSAWRVRRLTVSLSSRFSASSFSLRDRATASCCFVVWMIFGIVIVGSCQRKIILQTQIKRTQGVLLWVPTMEPVVDAVKEEQRGCLAEHDFGRYIK